MKLTDEQVVKVLSERLGWKSMDGSPQYFKVRTTMKDVWSSISYSNGVDIHSRDALQPVLDGLSESERVSLIRILRDEYHAAGNSAQFGSFEGLIWILAIPARTLAHAIAESISAP